MIRSAVDRRIANETGRELRCFNELLRVLALPKRPASNRFELHGIACLQLVSAPRATLKQRNLNVLALASGICEEKKYHA